MRYREVIMKDYLCDRCGESVGDLEGWPHYREGEDRYCPECALVEGIIGVDDYLFNMGYHGYDHAEYDRENSIITVYEKWGRGFHKEKIKLEKVAN